MKLGTDSPNDWYSLKHDYSVLHRIYRQGLFEDEVAEYAVVDDRGFTYPVYFPGNTPDEEVLDELNRVASTHGALSSDLPVFRSTDGSRRVGLKEAAEQLYALACRLEPDRTQIFNGAIRLPIRSLALSYEIHDYFLCVGKEWSKFFVDWAKKIVSDVDGYMRSNYLASDDRERLALTKDLLIIALCGVNELYRQHHSLAYEEALRLLSQIKFYVDGPLRRAQRQESFGLTGLTAYLTGRASFALGRRDAAQAFISSTEAYANRVHQKEEARDRKEISPEEYEETRLVSLRRSALAASLGSGYLSLAQSRVSEALKSVALARGVLKQNCGEVYVAYTEFIYAQAKRALNTSDIAQLKYVNKLLRRCEQVFDRLVPHSHYPQRVRTERAILYHYIAQYFLQRLERRFGRRRGALPERQRARLARFYRAGIDLLTGAIQYARPDAGEQEPVIRNPRLLAEALYLRSHLRRHHAWLTVSKDGPLPGLGEAKRDAMDALRHAEGMRQLVCEAHIALGAAYAAQAAETEGGEGKIIFPPDERARLRERARNEFALALETNDGANPRVSADCYLHLVRWALLVPTTYPDAAAYYKKYKEDVEGLVEHEYCHNVAESIGRELDEAGPFLYVDVRASMVLADWNERVRCHLIEHALIDLAKTRGPELLSLHDTKRRKGDPTQTPTRAHEQRAGGGTIKSLIADELIQLLRVSRATAYNWIRNEGLEESLLMKCRTLKSYSVNRGSSQH